MAVPPSLLPSHSEKVLNAMKAERTVKRITFNPRRPTRGDPVRPRAQACHERGHRRGLARPRVQHKLKITGAHANNYLVQNVSRSLVDKFVVKFAGKHNPGHDVLRNLQDFRRPLSLQGRAREHVARGIQSSDLCKIRSGAGDKKTSGVDAENELNAVYGTKYRINLDHPILTDHGVFYPQALYNDLVFEITLASAHEVVKGSDGTKLGYKLENIQLEYEVIRSKTLADEAMNTYASGKEFAYDFVMREMVVPITRGSDTRLNLRVNPQRKSLKGILLLFINPYTAGARDSENYFNPDINKVKVTVNGVPNRVCNEGSQRQ